MSEEKVSDSKHSKMEEEAVELEGLFVLRLPPAAGTSLRLSLESGGLNLQKRLKIRIQEDMRKCHVQYDGWSLTGKIMDLPTIIECLKTLDKKVFYKTGDICQIMICEDADETQVLDEEPKTEKEKIFPHGVTAPLKNSRRRRFRKTLKKKNAELPDYEKEVKRLFRQDLEAISVRYELVSEEDDKQSKSETSNGNGFQPPDIDEAELFGEISSSSEESAEEEEEEIVNLSEELAKDLVDINLLAGSDYAAGAEESMPDDLEVPEDMNEIMEMENVSELQLESETAGENLGHLLLEQMMEDEKAELREKVEK